MWSGELHRPAPRLLVVCLLTTATHQHPSPFTLHPLHLGLRHASRCRLHARSTATIICETPRDKRRDSHSLTHPEALLHWLLFSVLPYPLNAYNIRPPSVSCLLTFLFFSAGFFVLFIWFIFCFHEIYFVTCLLLIDRKASCGLFMLITQSRSLSSFFFFSPPGRKCLDMSIYGWDWCSDMFTSWWPPCEHWQSLASIRVDRWQDPRSRSCGQRINRTSELWRSVISPAIFVGRRKLLPKLFFSSLWACK